MLFSLSRVSGGGPTTPQGPGARVLQAEAGAGTKTR